MKLCALFNIEKLKGGREGGREGGWFQVFTTSKREQNFTNIERECNWKTRKMFMDFKREDD
jgi:hypothetical protein